MSSVAADSDANPRPAHPRTRTVALVGNPNTGKTSLFNALTGFRRHVANYPGVTVEVARGRLSDSSVEIIDLPGTYSLAPVSPDEEVACKLLCGDGSATADAILAIVDASNLPRNLYLISQLLELNRPMVVALNMVDIARSRGIHVDAGELSAALGAPVVPVVATDRSTVSPLISQLRSLDAVAPSDVRAALPPALEREAREIVRGAPAIPRAALLRALLDPVSQERRRLESAGVSLAAASQRLRDAGIDGPAHEIRARHAWAAAIADRVTDRAATRTRTWTDRLDALLTHRVGGVVALLVVFAIVFQAIFQWADPAMKAIEGAFAALAGLAATLIPEGALRSLVCDGLIAGVGGVIVFLPQIMILFGLIALLEDCGYLARAAYIMDRVMRTFGLSGRAFIPLLSSFACAVPAIMGTRTIADWRERLVTIFIAPLMSCSARLPVYVLMIAAFVPDRSYLGGAIQLHGLVLLAAYCVGVVVAAPISWLLRRHVLPGPPASFVMELPSYKRPRLRAVAQRMLSAGRKFLVSAGTLILVVNLLVWTLGYFPRSATTEQRVRSVAAAERWDDARVEQELAGAYLRESYLGRLGHAIEPVVRPLGWDWRIGMAVIASFPAREVVIGTLGTIFNLGAEEDESSETLRESLAAATWPDGATPLFTLPVALSIIVFFALCMQCASTLVVMARETRSLVWPAGSLVGMTALAYAAAWATAALARACGG